MDFETVFHRKIVNLFQRFSFIAQVGKAVHQKTVAGGSAEGIHDEDFPFRVALFKVGFGDHRRIQDTGNAEERQTWKMTLPSCRNVSK